MSRLLIGALCVAGCAQTPPLSEADQCALDAARNAWAAHRPAPVCAPLSRMLVTVVSREALHARCCDGPCTISACSPVEGWYQDGQYVHVMISETVEDIRGALIVHEAMHHLRACAIHESIGIGLTLEEYAARVRWGIPDGAPPAQTTYDLGHEDRDLWVGRGGVIESTARAAWEAGCEP